ncbi:MAG: sigma-70 family RNA polymerase sigma factor [Planctomycetota bacterium]
MDNASTQVTQLLNQASGGDRESLDRVFAIVYDELKQLAHRQRPGQLSDHALQTTALVHEAYVKLVDSAVAGWESRAHFFGVAAKAMRSILVDHARARKTQKRGGERERVPLDEALDQLVERDLDVLSVNEALARLGKIDARKEQVVELRFFAGLENKDTAAILGVSHDTVERDWTFARAWLRRELAG